MNAQPYQIDLRRAGFERVRELAERLGVNRQRLYYLIQHEKVQARTVGIAEKWLPVAEVEKVLGLRARRR